MLHAFERRTWGNHHRQQPVRHHRDSHRSFLGINWSPLRGQDRCSRLVGYRNGSFLRQVTAATGTEQQPQNDHCPNPIKIPDHASPPLPTGRNSQTTARHGLRNRRV